MTDREAFNEFARGAAMAVGVAGVFVLFVAILGIPEENPKEKFTVVDTYKGCDVVRYTDRSNDWHYFLDCNGSKDR